MSFIRTVLHILKLGPFQVFPILCRSLCNSLFLMGNLQEWLLIEQTVTFQKIPAMSDIADANFPGGGNMVISGSRESMNAEVAAMRNRSSEILGSVDHHRSVLESCDKMLQILNPEFAERQRQDAENKALRQELSELRAMMADFLKSSEKASSSNNSKKQ